LRTQTGSRSLVRPELRGFDCADLDPIEAWVPDGDEVVYWLTLTIGEPGSVGADDFQVCVATPAGLKSQLGRRSRPRGSGEVKAIVVQEYSWNAVLNAIEERLDACRGHHWGEVQEKLRAHFNWEYKGMR
jgi:hypothetical protein